MSEDCHRPHDLREIAVFNPNVFLQTVESGSKKPEHNMGPTVP